MRLLGETWRRLVVLLRRDAAARDLDDEMRLHREMKSEELRADGIDETEARYAASRAFGSAGQSAWSIASNFARSSSTNENVRERVRQEEGRANRLEGPTLQAF